MLFFFPQQSTKQRGAPGRGLKVVGTFTNLGGGLAEIDAEFKFAKIQNSYVEGGWGGGGLTEINAEFKFAKIQNYYVEGGGGGDSRKLMLSSNLLKSKIPMLRVGGGAQGN